MRPVLCLIFAALATGAAAAPRQIAIYNDADFAIVELQARAPKTQPWAIDLLGKYSLGVGRAAKATFPANAAGCAYDLLATFDDGRKQQMLNVNTCKPGTITFTGPV